MNIKEQEKRRQMRQFVSSAQVEPIAVMEGHKDRVWHLAWHPVFPNVFASCGGDPLVHIWSCDRVRAGSESHSFYWEDGVSSTSPSADSPSLVSRTNLSLGSRSRQSNGWRCIASLDTPQQHERTIRHLSWSPSGRYLACASFDATISIWVLEDEEEMDAMGMLNRGNRESREDVKSEEEQIAGKETVVDAEDSPLSCPWVLEGVLDGHENEVKCVEWLTDTVLVSCSRDRSVWVWERIDAGEYECVGVLTGHQQDVKYCLWSRTFPGNMCMTTGSTSTSTSSTALSSLPPQVISCSYDGTVRVWSEGSQRAGGGDWECIQVLNAPRAGRTIWCGAFQTPPHTDALNGMAELNEQEMVKTMRGVNEEEDEAELPHKTAMDSAATKTDSSAFTCSSNSSFPLLCTCADDASLSFYRYNPALDKYQFLGQSSGFAERSLYSVDWAPCGLPIVATASGDNSITLLFAREDYEGLHPEVLHKESNAHFTDVNTVRFSSFLLPTHHPMDSSDNTEEHAPDKEDVNPHTTCLLTSGGDDGLIRVWKISFT